jgi:hypothetical protein
VQECHPRPRHPRGRWDVTSGHQRGERPGAHRYPRGEGGVTMFYVKGWCVRWTARNGNEWRAPAESDAVPREQAEDWAKRLRKDARRGTARLVRVWTKTATTRGPDRGLHVALPPEGHVPRPAAARAPARPVRSPRRRRDARSRSRRLRGLLAAPRARVAVPCPRRRPWLGAAPTAGAPARRSRTATPRACCTTGTPRAGQPCVRGCEGR